LRSKAKESPMSASEYENKFGKRKYENTIEHISPVNPKSSTYPEEFKNNWLNNIGNLVLMTKGKNSQLSNDAPVDKVDRLQNSTLLSQREVGEIIKKKGKWDQEEIKARQDEIIKFAKRYWNPDNSFESL
jgi:hypothetical protein